MIWERLHRIDRRWVDVGLVLILQSIYLGWAITHHPTAIPLTFAATLPLLMRRRFPLHVLAAVLAAALALHELYGWWEPVAVWFAVLTVATLRSRRVALVAGAATVATFLADGIHHPGWLAGRTVSVALALLLGDTVKSRREFLAAERAKSARRAVEDEQARIARELHDVIAHNVSVMVVQAAAANDVFDSRPEQARESLEAIERTGRAALAELRRLLGVVREPASPALAPQPGLTGLELLVDGVRAAGLPVALHVDGELGDLPAGLGLSAYRIVQEALTNTLKHAEASRAEVGIRRTARSVELEILDDGLGAGPGDGAGQGLIGMRERASLVGGDVDAGPLPSGGYRVRASLPL